MKRIDISPMVVRGELQAVVPILVSFLSAPTNAMSGMSFQDVRARSRVIDRLEVARGYVDLEDADHQTLKDVLVNGRFNVADAGIVKLVDRVLDAKESPALPLPG